MAQVVAVHRSGSHSFSKHAEDAVTLVPGIGVQGDAHAGVTVKHRSRVRRDPSSPNLRQVHLMHAELFDELMARGFAVWPGDLGENVTTRGLDLLALPTGARLRLGERAVVEVTGLRNPCSQLDRFQPGLMAAVLDKRPDGALAFDNWMQEVYRRAKAQSSSELEALKPSMQDYKFTPVT